MAKSLGFSEANVTIKAMIALAVFIVAVFMGSPSAAQSPDGVEDTDFPVNYWALTYYEGRDGVEGSSSWGNSANGSGGTGTRQFRGEAFFGIGSNDVTIASNGSASFNRWSNTETPTSPNLHHPSYVGSVWTGSNPHYQIDARRRVAQSGTLTFGFGSNEVVDDVIEVFVNGT